jgi:hypothetical protein
VAMNRIMDSRKGVSKTNKLITGDWKNALTAMKIISIPQEVLDGLRLALNEYDLIRRHGFATPISKDLLMLRTLLSLQSNFRDTMQAKDNAFFRCH